MNKDLLSLQDSVNDSFNDLNILITEEEEKLRNLNLDKNSCIKDIESCFLWLREVVNEFPDMKTESMESNLSSSQNIVASIKDKSSCLNSIIEKTQLIAKDLPAQEKESLERKVKELKDYFGEIQNQADDYIRDLHEKTNDKREVNKLFNINLFCVEFVVF